MRTMEVPRVDPAAGNAPDDNRQVDWEAFYRNYRKPGYIPGYPTPGSGGSSYVPSNPLPETPIDPGTAVVVANPEKNGASISFVAGGRRFTLAPGYQQVVRQAHPDGRRRHRLAGAGRCHQHRNHRRRIGP